MTSILELWCAEVHGFTVPIMTQRATLSGHTTEHGETRMTICQLLLRVYGSMEPEDHPRPPPRAACPAAAHRRHYR